MFLKSIHKYCKTEKTSIVYYRLCESYRDEYGTPKQHMVISLGRLEELPDIDEKMLLVDRINEKLKGSPTLFKSGIHKTVEDLAHHYYEQIRTKKKLDSCVPSSDEIVSIKLNSLKNKDVREIGAESICYQAFKQLGIEKYLSARGWNTEHINLAATHVVSRAVYPASELKTVSWIKENSGICELTRYDPQNLTKDKLYGISKKLYQEKEGLENYLSRCTNDLFNLHDKVILYDLTNTYFEGSMKNSAMAKFGRSKEKRTDAKIIVLAVVVNTEGFLKYSDIFEGNTTDHSTLEHIITKLDEQHRYTSKKPIVVMDAGIATEDNIQFLKTKAYPYLCVSRSSMKKYKTLDENLPVKIMDKKGQTIELKQVKVEADGDNYLWVKSHAKAQKEQGMHDQFSQRFEEGLRAIRNGIDKKGGTKKLDKVWERIGRLKEKYPSVHKYYEIKVADNGSGTATCLSFNNKSHTSTNNNAGVYFLRTSLDWDDQKAIWTIYNSIREIEYTFRVLKTDLDLRPIFHKTDEASMAHLNLGLLAYWLVSTIRYQLKQTGYTHDWREIVRTMNTQKIVTTTFTNEKDDVISIRQCSEPSKKVRVIYDKLRYNPKPFSRKKSVWHTEKLSKNKCPEKQFINDG
jgi:hypothetical protein